MEADSGFLALAKISAFSRPGIRAGLRRLLQMLLVTFSYANLPPRLLEIFKKNRKKCYTFYFFKHIICASERANEPRR